MTKKTFYIIISILLLLFLVQHIFIKQPDILQKVASAKDFSDVEINLLGGSFEPIGFYKDKKPVVLVFWISTSDPCRLILDDFAGKLDTLKEAEIITVNVGEAENVVEKTKDLWKINMKIGLDPERKIADQFGINKLPTVILLAKAGSVLRKWQQYEPEIPHIIERNITDDKNEAGDSAATKKPDAEHDPDE